MPVPTWYCALTGATPRARRQSLTAAAALYARRFDAALPAPLRVVRSGKTVIVVYPVPAPAPTQPIEAQLLDTMWADGEALVVVLKLDGDRAYVRDKETGIAWWIAGTRLKPLFEVGQ